jgi:hypothetical protein
MVQRTFILRGLTATVLLVTPHAEHMFKKDGKVPAEIKKAKLEGWYSGLDDQSKVRMSRYLQGINTGSSFDFFTDAIGKAMADENYAFAVKLCEDIYSNVDMTDLQRFSVNELLIDSYFGCERFDDVKAACEANYDLFPKVREQLEKANNGKVPEVLAFRNQYINVIVGVESNYDLGFEMLKRYNEMGILSDEDLEYRTNSLRTHRLQRVFDGVYTYRPKDEEL